jgi:hypothetical protein
MEYYLTKPLVAFAASERRAFTIPSGSVVEGNRFLATVGLTAISWAGKLVTVFIQDLRESSKPMGEDGGFREHASADSINAFGESEKDCAELE